MRKVWIAWRSVQAALVGAVGIAPATVHAEGILLFGPSELEKGLLALVVGIVIALVVESGSRRRKKNEEKSSEPDGRAERKSKKGTCPNCRSVIPLDSKQCPHCTAVFGDGAAWRVEPL
jgi:hypothetical protein